MVECCDLNNDSELSELKAALFNLRLPPDLALEAGAHVLAAFNKRRQSPRMDLSNHLVVSALPDGSMPIMAAMAVVILSERAETITDAFRSFALDWFKGLESLPTEVKPAVLAAIDAAWPGSKKKESPVHRPRTGFPTKKFHDIVNGMMSRLPTKRLTGE